MDAVTNPYSPGAGLRPAVLAGRDGERAAFDAVLQRATLDRPVRGLMLTGLRGVGKTVLLNELADSAEEAGWITVGMEVRSDGARPFLATVAQQLSAGLRRGLGRKIGTATTRALASVKAFSLTVDPTGQIGVNIDLDAAGSGDLEVDFAALAVDVGRRARELGIGVAVMVDELQELDKRTLAAVAAAAHAAGQRGVPFVIVGAGLPSLPGRLAEAKSYSERLFDYRPPARLDADTAARAVTEPAADSGASWEPDAVTTVVDAANGYPYFLQEYGSAPVGRLPPGRASPPMTPRTASLWAGPSSTVASFAHGGTEPRPPNGSTSQPWPPTASAQHVLPTSRHGWTAPNPTSGPSAPA